MTATHNTNICNSRGGRASPPLISVVSSNDKSTAVRMSATTDFLEEIIK